MVEKAGAVSFAGTVPALLYRTLQKNSVEQAYIESMWGDPYLHTITHWAAIPQERRESLQKEYPEMQDLAEEVEEDRRDFLDKFDNFNDTPAGQFLNNIGFALSAVAAVHPVGRGAVCAARIGVTVAAGLPKVVKAVQALGAVEIAREFSILCNKKSGGDSEIGKSSSTHENRIQRTSVDLLNYFKKLRKLPEWKFFRRSPDGRHKAYRNTHTGEIRYNDDTHNEVECFDKSKRHFVLDPKTETRLKKPAHKFPDWLK